MSYKKFKEWCNDRAMDGCWSFSIAVYLLEIYYRLESYPFWKRSKIWHNTYEKTVVEQFIKPIDKMRE